MNARVFFVFALLLLAAVAPSAKAADNPAALKRQMQEFERVLNQALLQMFENRPFAILQEAKSVYLPGFGIVVHTELNLYPMRWILPFSPDPYSEKELKTEREQKAERLRNLNGRLRDLLLAQSVAFSQVSAEENLAVVIHLFNPRPFPEIPSQVVALARRQALLNLQGDGRKPAPEELARAITVREF